MFKEYFFCWKPSVSDGPYANESPQDSTNVKQHLKDVINGWLIHIYSSNAHTEAFAAPATNSLQCDVRILLFLHCLEIGLVPKVEAELPVQFFPADNQPPSSGNWMSIICPVPRKPEALLIADGIHAAVHFALNTAKLETASPILADHDLCGCDLVEIVRIPSAHFYEPPSTDEMLQRHSRSDANTERFVPSTADD